jgi:hypothetical protein
MVKKEVIVQKLKELIDNLSKESSGDIISIHYTELAAILNISTPYSQQLLKAYCREIGGTYVSGRCIVKRSTGGGNSGAQGIQ